MSEIYYEEGKYRVEVTGACLGESKNGTPQIEVGVSVKGYFGVGGMYTPIEGPDRTVYLSVNENTMGTPADPGWVWQTLTDLGFVGPSLADLGPLVGQVRDAGMKVDTYEGKASEKWSIFRRKGSSAMRPVEAKKTREIDAKFSGLLRTVKGQKPAQAGAKEGTHELPAQETRPATRPATQADAERLKRPTPARGRNGRVVDAALATIEQDEIPNGAPSSKHDIPF